MKIKLIILGVVISLMTLNCSDKKGDYYLPESEDSFEFKVDQFADLAILRYQIPGWEELSLKEK